MLWINLKIALRNLRKYKLYAAINVLGLAVGMAIYVFTGIGAKGATQYDSFFENSDRIYALSSTVGPDIDIIFKNINTTFTTIGPLIDAELVDVEATARKIPRDFLVRVNERADEEEIYFSDAALLDIFDFEYLYGNKEALRDPTGLLLTESAAVRLFGSTDILGLTVEIDNQINLQVTAVIKDLPDNTNFRSSELFASIGALVSLGEIEPEGRWGARPSDKTYVLLPPHLDKEWLNTQLDELYERHTPEPARGGLSGIFAVHISEMEVFDLFGIPVIYLIFIPSIMILGIACINYTNLATAQSLRRSREIGMRKTMGATRSQLLWQFLTESVLISALAMLLATATVEVLVSFFENVLGETIGFNSLKVLPWLITSALVIGIAAGSYPAWMITRVSPIDALRDIGHKGISGVRMRSVMIGVQFTVSIFMLAAVLVVDAQNQKIEEASYAFPRSEIYTLTELRVAGELVNLDILQHEIEALPTVESVSFSTSTPFNPGAPVRLLSLASGDEASNFKIAQFGVTPEFFATYDIPLLAGRNLSKNIASDEFLRGVSESLNVVINEPALALLGLSTPEEAINKRFFNTIPDAPLREFIVVGVASVPNFAIVQMQAMPEPSFFFIEPNPIFASIRFTAGTDAKTLSDLESTWNRIAPAQPMQGQFLDETFELMYSEIVIMNKVIAVLTFIALSLAIVGLFGLSAFMSGQRAREISVRKVFGAEPSQIVALLTWQITKPVTWALAIALPLGFVVATFYLSFFPYPTEYAIPIILLSGLIALLLGWATVAGQTYRIARAKPITALRYE